MDKNNSSEVTGSEEGWETEDGEPMELVKTPVKTPERSRKRDKRPKPIKYTPSSTPKKKRPKQVVNNLSYITECCGYNCKV